MPTPNIDNNYIAISFLPKNRKKNKFKAFFKGISSGMVWIGNLFKNFLHGTEYETYSTVVSYSKGDRVENIFGVFESRIDNNLNNDTSNIDCWYKILDNFIGAKERVLFSNHRIILENALNRKFKTTFRQPESYSGTGQLPLSDIYIESENPIFTSIIGYDSLHEDNTLFNASTTYWGFDTLIVGTASSYKFSINIPLLVFNNLGSNNDIREKIVRSFVDLYYPIGTNYTVETY